MLDCLVFRTYNKFFKSNCTFSIGNIRFGWAPPQFFNQLAFFYLGWCSVSDLGIQESLFNEFLGSLCQINVFEKRMVKQDLKSEKKPLFFN